MVVLKWLVSMILKRVDRCDIYYVLIIVDLRESWFNCEELIDDGVFVSKYWVVVDLGNVMMFLIEVLLVSNMISWFNL